MNLDNFLLGKKIIESIHSSINGDLEVVSDLAWGTHILGGGLTQSGGIAGKIWETSLKKAKRENINPKTMLVLGLGGGSIAKIGRKLWPQARITGVDIDPVIVDLGRKYLKLDETKTEVVIADALEYVTNSPKFDLICLDTYKGDNFPTELESIEFIQSLERILNSDGALIVNRLYYDDKRSLATKFLGRLQKIFGSVEVVYPVANVMYICKG